MSFLPLPKAIFFDWDGTLVDSYSFIEKAHTHTHDKLGIKDYSPETFKAYFGEQRDQIFTGLYGEKREEAIIHFEDFIINNHIKDLNPMQNAQELLDFITGAGIITGVVSNKKSEFIRDEITNFGWDKYFTSVTGAGDAKRDKPHADPLLEALLRINLPPHSEQVWYVGDTDIDMLCAKNAECGAIFVQSHQKTVPDGHNPLLVVENCLQLHEFLLQCVGNN